MLSYYKHAAWMHGSIADMFAFPYVTGLMSNDGLAKFAHTAEHRLIS